MRSFKLLTNESVTQVVQLTYVSGSMTPDQKFKIPDGFLYGDNASCQFEANTFSSESIED